MFKIQKFWILFFFILPFGKSSWIQFEKLLNILNIQIISKKWKNKFDNKTTE